MSGLGGWSFSFIARDAGGGSAETSAIWRCDGGGTLVTSWGKGGSVSTNSGNKLGKAHLGIADATAGVDGDAGRHCARCCDHACAAWSSWPTNIQPLQTLQRTLSPSYLRASGSPAINGGGGSFTLYVGSEGLSIMR